jgi:hypothetical protein
MNKVVVLSKMLIAIDDSEMSLKAADHGIFT